MVNRFLRNGSLVPSQANSKLGSVCFKCDFCGVLINVSLILEMDTLDTILKAPFSWLTIDEKIILLCILVRHPVYTPRNATATE